MSEEGGAPSKRTANNFQAEILKELKDTESKRTSKWRLSHEEQLLASTQPGNVCAMPNCTNKTQARTYNNCSSDSALKRKLHHEPTYFNFAPFRGPTDHKYWSVCSSCGDKIHASNASQTKFAKYKPPSTEDHLLQIATLSA